MLFNNQIVTHYKELFYLIAVRVKEFNKFIDDNKNKYEDIEKICIPDPYGGVRVDENSIHFSGFDEDNFYRSSESIPRDWVIGNPNYEQYAESLL